MNKVFKVLRDFFFITLFAGLFEKFQKNVAGKIKPFSWQTSLLLSLLAWFVFLIVQGLYPKRFVSLFGWFFLILASYWYFTDELEKKKLEIPGVKLYINYGPWVTGALLCLALYSNQFLLFSWQATLVIWPLVSVIIAAIQKFLVRQENEMIGFKVPKDAGVRQDVVILVLIGCLISCWLQFHFVIQNIVAEYPSLLADNFRNSAFVTRLNPRPVANTRGAAILNNAEVEVRRALDGRSWLDVQRWLRNIQTEVPQIENVSIDRAYKNAPGLEESDFWRVAADFTDALPDDILRLQAIWIGPSSQPGGYALEKKCLIRPITSDTPSSPNLYNGVPYEMTCQPITSGTKQLPTGNFGAETGRIVK